MGNTSTVVSLKLELADEVLTEYERQADGHKPLDQLLVDRLAESVHHTSKRPLYLSDEQRAEIEKLLGRNLYRPKDLVDAVKRLGLVRVENVQVHFEPVLMERLKSRHFSDLPFDAWLTQQVIQWAEQFAGMR